MSVHLGLTVAAAIALSCAVGCGGGSSSGERPPDAAARVRDAAGDVHGGLGLEQPTPGKDWDDAIDEIRAEGGDRPALDLRELVVERRDRRLRLEVETTAPTRSSVIVLVGSTRGSCPDRGALEVVVRTTADGIARVRASDLSGRAPTALAGAHVELDGTRLRVELPRLPAGSPVDLWTASSGELGRSAEPPYGDAVPDQGIEGAYFTRGTGTPNDAGDFCGATTALQPVGADGRIRELPDPADVADGRTPPLAELDRSRDVVDVPRVELRRAFDDLPTLDLLAAGAEVRNGVLRVRVLTASPLSAGSLRFEASTERECVGAQLAVAVDVFPGGGTSVRAAEQPFSGLRFVPGARATVDGRVVELELPLRDAVPLPEWTVLSGGLGSRPSVYGYADTLPDLFITGAYFTRDTGTPDYPKPCGPAEPPLLPTG